VILCMVLLLVILVATAFMVYDLLLLLHLYLLCKVVTPVFIIFLLHNNILMFSHMDLSLLFYILDVFVLSLTSNLGTLTSLSL
jgi:hypothetical protein